MVHGWIDISLGHLTQAHTHGDGSLNGEYVSHHLLAYDLNEHVLVEY